MYRRPLAAGRTRRVAARWPAVLALLALLAAACDSQGATETASGTLPSADHVHSLRWTDDGALLLGLHGALWRSDDHGASWQLAGLEGQDAMSIGVAAAGAPLLVAGHDVLVRSLDGGATFTPLDPPELPSLDIHALAQAPSEPDTVYAFVVGAGIHRSLDAGTSWQAVAAIGETVPPDTTALFVSPSEPAIVLLGSGSQGIFRSDDSAATFTRVSEWGTLGLAAGGDPVVAVAATFQGVDVSTDLGDTWTNAAPADDFDGQPLAVTVGDGSLWVVTEQPRVLYRSDDDGTSWQEVARA